MLRRCGCGCCCWADCRSSSALGVRVTSVTVVITVVVVVAVVQEEVAGDGEACRLVRVLDRPANRDATNGTHVRLRALTDCSAFAVVEMAG